MQTKRTRHERKLAQRVRFAELENLKLMKQERLNRYQKEHPILSGAVKIVDYIPPK